MSVSTENNQLKLFDRLSFTNFLQVLTLLLDSRVTVHNCFYAINVRKCA